MKKMRIKIHHIADIADFVAIANQVSKANNYDINVYKGSIVVDGASLISMMSMDLSAPVEVEYPEQAKNFENFISQFKVE